MKIKKRVIFVNTFIILFILYTCISIRGEYLQIVGIGEKYVEIFKHNLEQRIYVFLVGFAVIYLLTYITTAFIKKGLRKFFIEEKKEMPKLPNKSISLAFGAIAGLIFSGLITEKAILAFNRTFFEVSEPVFNLDISYYVFIKPFIEAILYSLIVVMAIMCVYITIYYLISFHKYFEKGINIETLRKSTFIKQIVAYIFFIILVISALAIIMVQDIVLGKFTQTNNGTSLYGAGFVDVTIKKWGYIIFSAFIVICGITALIKARKGQYKKACYTVVLIPIYLVGLFFVILSTNIIYVNHNELDKQKSYVKTNIEYTKKAYDINIDEINLKDAGTITAEDLANNAEVIDNINIFNRLRVLSHLEEYQTSLGFYTFSTTRSRTI